VECTGRRRAVTEATSGPGEGRDMAEKGGRRTLAADVCGGHQVLYHIRVGGLKA